MRLRAGVAPGSLVEIDSWIGDFALLLEAVFSCRKLGAVVLTSASYSNPVPVSSLKSGTWLQ